MKLVSAWKVVSAIEKLNFCFILIYLNLSHHRWMVATVWAVATASGSRLSAFPPPFFWVSSPCSPRAEFFLLPSVSLTEPHSNSGVTGTHLLLTVEKEQRWCLWKWDLQLAGSLRDHENPWGPFSCPEEKSASPPGLGAEFLLLVGVGSG